MAAIAGVLLFGEGDAAGELRRLIERLRHRSPDGIGSYSGGRQFALAHGALHTTPESIHDRQPRRLGDRWVILVDGRIDNRTELSRTLGFDADALATTGDAELFAHAWWRWGTGFWQHVVGDFALAAWDREQRALTLVRDRLGARPLYLARTSTRFAFASEPDALLALEGVDRSVSDENLAHLLGAPALELDPRATWHRGVQRLLPGEWMRIESTGETARERYWRLQPQSLLHLRSEQDYIDAFREVFEEAVRCRLRSLQRPALMLSGGIDSASVLAAVRRTHAGTPLPITVVADDQGTCEETRNIESMLAATAGDAVRLPVPSFAGSVGVEALADAAFGRAHPTDNSILLPRLVYLAARRAGSNVVLDGIDGDLATLTENDYAGALMLAGHPLRAWREASLASQHHTYLKGRSPARILAYGMAVRLEPPWLSGARYRRAAPRRRFPWIDDGFAQRMRLRERLLERQIAERRRRHAQDDQAALIDAWGSPGFRLGLEGFDRTAAWFGVEARHPWCDVRVVEFFLRLPPERKVRDGWTKHIVRAAYAGVLGDKVAWHSGKAHLGPEVTRRVLLAAPERVAGLLGDVVRQLDGHIDQQALERLRTSWPPPARRDGWEHVAYDVILEMATLGAWLKAS